MAAGIAPLICIVGPTASGKSALAMRIAKEYGGEIICADSRTIYTGMDIGTAKPSVSDRAEVQHYLLDVTEPDESFTAAQFKRLATTTIADIWSRKKWPILVGGSGLYVDSVLFDYEFGKPVDHVARELLNEMSIQELQARCREKNIELPENYLNKRYLIRAIEMGGLLQHKRVLRSNTIVVGIATEKEELRLRIEERAHTMVRLGIINEVRRLGDRYGWEVEAMKGNIYRVFRQVVEGSVNVDEAIVQVISSDMKLAKKQMTWFKRNPHIVWDEPQKLESVIQKFVETHSR